MPQPSKYRKKPVVIEAMEYDGVVDAALEEFVVADWFHSGGHLMIRTLEGDHRCDVGDFIIKGVAGEFYPCKPGVFQQTYEAV